MASLIYSAITSLDGYVEDQAGSSTGRLRTTRYTQTPLVGPGAASA
jgi:hypothetical protein